MKRRPVRRGQEPISHELAQEMAKAAPGAPSVIPPLRTDALTIWEKRDGNYGIGIEHTVRSSSLQALMVRSWMR